MSNSLTRSSQLESVTTYLREVIAPQAAAIDRDPAVLQIALRGMGDRNLLALKVPQNLGGSGWDERKYRRWQILMARYSGALTFLQTQHQSAVSQISKSDNLAIQQEYLPHAGSGRKLVGVGFSHLRRSGKPMVSALPVTGGYLISGSVPWITGYNFFQDFIVGATLPDGRELYGIIPFNNTADGKLTFSDPMSLIAMSATNTVSGELNGYLLKNNRLVTIKPPGSIHLSSRQNILHHGFYALGCAYGGLDILKALADSKQLPFVAESWQNLRDKVKECEAQLFVALASQKISYQEKLKLRARTINLAGKCSHAAVIATSGMANAIDSPAGRVYREALLFSVSGQTVDVMGESLAQLID